MATKPGKPDVPPVDPPADAPGQRPQTDSPPGSDDPPPKPK